MPLLGPYAYPFVATVAVLLLTAGFLLRRRDRKTHAVLMSAGMGMDLTVVLLLELTKDAVGTAVGDKLTPFQLAHVGTSTIAVALYLPVFVLGLSRLRNPGGRGWHRDWHVTLGYAALLFRALGFLFMFSMVGRTP